MTSFPNLYYRCLLIKSIQPSLRIELSLLFLEIDSLTRTLTYNSYEHIKEEVMENQISSSNVPPDSNASKPATVCVLYVSKICNNPDGVRI